MTYHQTFFADDYLIYRNIKNKQDQIALQKYLNLLENWGNTWGMRFNAAKCNIMWVSLIRKPKTFQLLTDRKSTGGSHGH